MIVPGRGLMLVVALAVIPLLTAAGLYPRWAGPCAIGCLVIACVAAVDAFAGIRASEGYRVTGPEAMRLVRDVPAEMVLDVVYARARKRRVAVYAELPDGMSQQGGGMRTIYGAGKVTIGFTPHRRGTFAIARCRIEISSLARLWQIRKVLPLQTEARVYPDLRGDRTAIALLSRAGTGLRTYRQLGKGREFERLRDYAPGDPFEAVSWKATARHGRPIVRVFQVERTQEIYILLDISRLSAREEAIEDFVKAALLLALAAEREGDRYGLVIFSDRVHDSLRASSGKAHYAAFREVLHRVQSRRVSADFSELFTFLQLRVRKRALLVFLTALDDPLLAETFARDLRLISRKHVAIVAVMDRDAVQRVFEGPSPQEDQDVYRGLAGHLAWAQREETRKNLERFGAQFAVVNASRAGAQLVALYAQTKQRQLL